MKTLEPKVAALEGSERAGVALDVDLLLLAEDSWVHLSQDSYLLAERKVACQMLLAGKLSGPALTHALISLGIAPFACDAQGCEHERHAPHRCWKEKWDLCLKKAREVVTGVSARVPGVGSADVGADVAATNESVDLKADAWLALFLEFFAESNLELGVDSDLLSLTDKLVEFVKEHRAQTQPLLEQFAQHVVASFDSVGEPYGEASAEDFFRGHAAAPFSDMAGNFAGTMKLKHVDVDPLAKFSCRAMSGPYLRPPQPLETPSESAAAGRPTPLRETALRRVGRSGPEIQTSQARRHRTPLSHTEASSMRSIARDIEEDLNAADVLTQYFSPTVTYISPLLPGETAEAEEVVGELNNADVLIVENDRTPTKAERSTGHREASAANKHAGSASKVAAKRKRTAEEEDLASNGDGSNRDRDGRDEEEKGAEQGPDTGATVRDQDAEQQEQQSDTVAEVNDFEPGKNGTVEVSEQELDDFLADPSRFTYVVNGKREESFWTSESVTALSRTDARKLVALWKGDTSVCTERIKDTEDRALEIMLSVETDVDARRKKWSVFQQKPNGAWTLICRSKKF
ncbi:hypothetical protein FVE85_4895 [Porphyridium purpureum]|uniref:Uncharacterized protein n=1 Tax=Porphyridium purpureum TaxID=35688 RepID=A0A5J4YR54_PORPP|nr:hypothetical protein FVE85_4895 [Porphyridium purpureum]|eukprot:POR8909..scf236_6